MKLPITHQHYAHCESGALATLLKGQGCEVSEAMIFGLSSGLIFLYFPLIKMGGCGLTSYRTPPGAIAKRFAKLTDLKLDIQRFASPQQGTEGLKRILDQGRLVGCQTSVYWLPYFPPHMRFHFNAHNLVVYGYEGDDFLLSDPIAENLVTCSIKDFEKARFAKGIFAPKGKCTTLVSSPKDIAYEKLIPKAIKKTCHQMLFAPVPWVGIHGVNHLARRIANLPEKVKDLRRVHLELTSVVRMQEEIGTGGAGFRFIYAAFLQEAAEKTGKAGYKECSEAMTLVGDQWRTFATAVARLVKKGGTAGYVEASELLRQCGQAEAKIHRDLLKIIK